MKKCPQCGYEDSLTNWQLARLYKKEFGSMPVAEMIKRGWLRVDDVSDIAEIEAEILKFFGVKTEDELWEKLSKPDPAMVCTLFDDKGRYL